MSEGHKGRIKLAVEKYLKKNDPALAKPKRTNNSPERDLQKEVIKWLNSIGWSVDSIESKAQYSQEARRYMSQPNKPGLPDIIGNDDQGHSVYIEMKAYGRRNTLRDSQREFLTYKIKCNCFAIVADSIEMIDSVYKTWVNYSDMSIRQNYLLNHLPKEKAQKDDGPLFPE